MQQHPDRAWAAVTTWSCTAVAAIAAVLLLVLAYTGPSLPITEVDFSGSRVFVARFAGAAFMAVLTLSCLLQAALLLPQQAAKRPGVSLPAVLDLLVIAGVVVETALVLSVGFDDDPRMNAAILAGGVAISAVALVRFVVIGWTGASEFAARRRERP